MDVGIILQTDTRHHHNHLTTHLITINDLGELRAPELDGLVQRQTDPLQKEAVLLPASMTQVVVAAQRCVQLLHAQGERLLGQLK